MEARSLLQYTRRRNKKFRCSTGKFKFIMDSNQNICMTIRGKCFTVPLVAAVTLVMRVRKSPTCPLWQLTWRSGAATARRGGGVT